jgi:hypothetical protein
MQNPARHRAEAQSAAWTPGQDCADVASRNLLLRNACRVKVGTTIRRSAQSAIFPDLWDGHWSRSARLWPRPAGDSEELSRVIGMDEGLCRRPMSLSAFGWCDIG